MSPSPLRVQILSISCSFRENLTKSYIMIYYRQFFKRFMLTSPTGPSPPAFLASLFLSLSLCSILCFCFYPHLLLVSLHSLSLFTSENSSYFVKIIFLGNHLTFCIKLHIMGYKITYFTLISSSLFLLPSCLVSLQSALHLLSLKCQQIASLKH